MSAEGRPEPRCPICGAAILFECPSCKFRLRGEELTGGIEYQRPEFCDRCGSRHQWAGRQALLYELENLLDEQQLDPADRLTVHEQLDALRRPDVSEQEQGERWARIKRLAPGLVDAGGRILESVASAAIRGQMGL